MYIVFNGKMHLRLRLEIIEIQRPHSFVQHPSVHHYWANPCGTLTEAMEREGAHRLWQTGEGRGLSLGDGHHSAEGRRALCRLHGDAVLDGMSLGATAAEEGSQRISGFRATLFLHWGPEEITEL